VKICVSSVAQLCGFAAWRESSSVFRPQAAAYSLQLSAFSLFISLLCLFAAIPLPLPAQGRASDPYLEIARSLAESVQKNSVSVGVGNFLYEDTDKTSAFSELLRDELERALAHTGKFKVSLLSDIMHSREVSQE